MAADKLRASLVVHMAENIDRYSELSPAVLQADLPPHLALQCNSMVDRLKLVSCKDACIGEIEVAATAEMLQKAIIVIDDSGETIQAYNNIYENQLSHTLCLRFIKDGGAGDAGHYEAVVISGEDGMDEREPSSSSMSSSTEPQQTQDINAKAFEADTIRVLAEQILPLPRKSPTSQKRKVRCKEATVLTSSPHKNLLETKQGKKRSRGTCRALGTKTSSSKKNKPNETDDWTCLICQENTKEAMTKCIMCGNWAHDKCTNGSNLCRFICDLCI